MEGFVPVDSRHSKPQRVLGTVIGDTFPNKITNPNIETLHSTIKVLLDPLGTLVKNKNLHSSHADTKKDSATWTSPVLLNLKAKQL